jgi:glycosyltransferase involved in cell wall biosynthesis
VRIALDARPAAFPGMTGVGHYTRQLLERLPVVDPGTEYVAWFLNARGVLSRWERRRRFPERPNLRERWTPIPASWFERSSQRLDLPRLEWLLRFDVLFAPNFVPPPTRYRALVLTVHDLAFRRFPETAPAATRRWLERLEQALRRAAGIIVVSEATRNDLLDLYPWVDEALVAVIPHGVEREVYRPPDPEAMDRVRRRFRLEGPYLLFLGGIEPRKNLPGLVRAFVRLDGDARLVVVGPSVPWNPEGREALRPVLEALPDAARERVVFTGYVAEEDKVALLGGAAALAFPSLYEGFGLPVLEAMACGTPVLTSNVSALPEVAGDAALLVDPEDPEAIADGLRRLLEDGDLRRRLREAGLRRAERFDWDETARRTAAVLHLAS